jgi:hypothetical protein
MAIFKTPADMFKAVETESRNRANYEYYKYKKGVTDGNNEYAKHHFSKSQEHYEIARLQDKLSVLFKSTSWQELQEMYNKLSLPQDQVSNP